MVCQGEYTTLVTPQDMDEETLKLIRQKRPKMQCKGGASNSAAQISYRELSFLPYRTNLKATIFQKCRCFDEQK